MLPQPGHIIWPNHTAVRCRADTEEQPPVTRTNGDIGDAIISLRRKLRCDGRVRPVVVECGDHAHVIGVAMRDEELAIARRDPTDRATHLELVARDQRKARAQWIDFNLT